MYIYPEEHLDRWYSIFYCDGFADNALFQVKQKESTPLQFSRVWVLRRMSPRWIWTMLGPVNEWSIISLITIEVRFSGHYILY